ncbi:DUF3524 domain-containing protein [Maioricimonas sp. JC845]|uniref:tRNA-queuosine alpha-mannosyltransferase domain-containing protein n=1 Tax=Maioricimonas sp. JC845 TaxID=3232138 RepID=UPI00345AC8D4
MRVLALNAFHGGSHRAFLEGWVSHSRHDFTLLTLPDRAWKWRMRHAPVTFASQVAAHPQREPGWDVLFCTDMLSLAEFRGLAPPDVRDLPAVAYFHENQLTYPARGSDAERQRDLHFAFSNFTTALAASEVWFNSEYHREVFLDGLAEWLPTMPDAKRLRLEEGVAAIRAKSVVQPPGIDGALISDRRPGRGAGPLHLVWAARWEHDKNPEDFFAAVRQLAKRGVDFRLSVLGETYRQVPACFAQARQEFADRILDWGFVSREEYRRVLASADVFVSTAVHEFFGIAAAEAIAAGCLPVLPDRLAYPELVQGERSFLYDGDVSSLVERLAELADVSGRERYAAKLAVQRQRVTRLAWPTRAAEMDERLERVW